MAATDIAAPEPDDGGLRRWTIEEFERLPDEMLAEWERADLIDGLIYTAEQTEREAFSRHYTEAALRTGFGAGAFTAMRMPLRLGNRSKVEPDILVLRERVADYVGRRVDPPADVALLVEISDTTLARDQRLKAGLYAREGVPEYWIVSLQNRTLEVRRLPRAEGYAETRVFAEDERAPANGRKIAVADLLPKAG